MNQNANPLPDPVLSHITLIHHTLTLPRKSTTYSRIHFESVTPSETYKRLKIIGQNAI